MSRRTGRRNVTVGLVPLLAGLLAAAGIWATMAERRDDSVERATAADEAAGHYVSAVADFRAQVIAQLGQHRGAHPGELRDVLDQAIAQFPKLPSPAPPGAEESRSYQAAVQVSRDGLKPFTDLRVQLDTAAQAEIFVAAADAALQRATNALLRTSLVFDSSPLKERTLPELRKALADVRGVAVPAKGQPAAQAVTSALSRAISEVETMIAELDGGGTHSYDLGDEFEAAATEVRNYAVDVDGDVREAVARLRDTA